MPHHHLLWIKFIIILNWFSSHFNWPRFFSLARVPIIFNVTIIHAPYLVSIVRQSLFMCAAHFGNKLKIKLKLPISSNFVNIHHWWIDLIWTWWPKVIKAVLCSWDFFLCVLSFKSIQLSEAKREKSKKKTIFFIIIVILINRLNTFRRVIDGLIGS